MRLANRIAITMAAVIFGLSLGVKAFGNILKLYYFHKSNITPELLILDAFVVLAIYAFYRVLR